MASASQRPNQKSCSQCQRWIDKIDYPTHVTSCTGRSNEDDHPREMKVCGLCGRRVKNLDDHYSTCDGEEKSSRSPRNSFRERKTKTCQLCSKQIDEDDYAEHIDRCDDQPSSRNSPSRSRQSDGHERDRHRPEAMKRCRLCSRDIPENEYPDHVDQCEDRDRYSGRSSGQRSTRRCPVCSNDIVEDQYHDHVDRCDDRDRHSGRSSGRRATRRCQICSKDIAEDEYHTHMDRCGDQVQYSGRYSGRRATRRCQICSNDIPEDEYRDHADRCDDRDRHSGRSSGQRSTRRCPVCSKHIAEDEYPNHVDRCEDRDRASTRSNGRRSTRRCQICSTDIPEDEYHRHVDRCGDRDRSSGRFGGGRSIRRCQICSNDIPEDEYHNHLDRCEDRGRYSGRSSGQRPTRRCPVCANDISENEYHDHVERCGDQKSTRTTDPPAPRRPKNTCYNCSQEITLGKDRSHKMPCRFEHQFCLQCLEKKANAHIEANSAPVCQPAMCDYELNRYEVACLPINAELIERLSACVKTTRRPQCPICSHYVEFKTMEDFYNHAGRCQVEDSAFCELCHCSIALRKLTEHEGTCRKRQSRERSQDLVAFVLPRTEYPLEAFQLSYFIERQRKSGMPLDPPSIIKALGQYGGTFPFDIPRRACGICLDEFIYDDIFVFGCDESHKICYACFAESCRTKKEAKELLTCAECQYRLTDGEVNQLRLPGGEKEEYRDYQVQKTFDIYKTTQGVVRCPSRECTWAAELANPDERIQVTCRVCEYQFCSICNGPYHFRTTCQEIPEITQRWILWCQTGRENYWRAKAQQNAAFNAQLAEFERQRNATAQRNEELHHRYNELVADEQYKAQNCRLCPHCGRVVQRLEGCDSMVCGRNYHGGDNQSGCGQGFNWSRAQPYVPINTGPAQVQFDMVAPAEEETIVHRGIQCDGCQQEVEGIRFDCIYCSSLVFCEKCEQRRTLEHYEENQREGQRQHIFRLTQRPVQEPEEF